MEEKAVVPRKKLVENLQKISAEKIDSEVINLLQKFSEKMVTDIVNRACLISKHKGQEFLNAEDVLFIVEKDFDYSFGRKRVDRSVKLPTEDHNTKVSEIRSSKPY